MSAVFNISDMGIDPSIVADRVLRRQVALEEGLDVPPAKPGRHCDNLCCGRNEDGVRVIEAEGAGVAASDYRFDEAHEDKGLFLVHRVPVAIDLEIAVAVHGSPSVSASVLDTPDASTATVGDAADSSTSPSGESAAPTGDAA